jgi:hypothetical protein
MFLQLLLFPLLLGLKEKEWLRECEKTKESERQKPH